VSTGLEAAPTPTHSSAEALERSTLRLLTCGSVDDGKSTLIGRLLYEQDLIPDDQLAALERDSRKHGTDGANIDFALLVDGLEAEREQGITIDVAYRYFATPRRAFIVADTPGHEQYTRNMATGASNADLALLLVDARKGLLEQTHRHAAIVALLGIKHVVLAINKIDLVGFDEKTFDTITAAFADFARPLGFASVLAIPLSARHGDNVSEPSARTPWYRGPSLIAYLEEIDIAAASTEGAFRLPVQWVNRPHLDFRGYAGTLARGSLRPGDEIVSALSGRRSKIARIVTADGDLAVASAGDPVTLTLTDELDIARGDVLAAADQPIPIADQFHAHLVWLHQDAMVPGRSYLFKFGTRLVNGAVTRLRHKLDVSTREQLSADLLMMNEIGVANIGLDAPVAYETFSDCPDLGGFIIIDRQSNATLAVGMIDYALRRATNLSWQTLDIDKAARAELKRQRPAVLWFTGLPGSGKSTISNLVEKRLHTLGCHTYVLDGDNVRHGLNKDLGFTEADRVENIRRVSEVAALFADAGLIVIVSFISPYRADRQTAREKVAADEFFEVFVDTPVAECQRRDPKGLYKKAAEGQLRNLTGVDAPYELPERPDIHVKTLETTAESAAEAIIMRLREAGKIFG